MGRPKRIVSSRNGLGRLGVGWLDLHRADDPHGHDRRPGTQRQPGHPGVPLVQQPGARAGALGVDTEQLAVLEHACRGVEGSLGCLSPTAIDGNHADQRKQVLGLPAVHVLGFAHVGHPAGQHPAARRTSPTPTCDWERWSAPPLVGMFSTPSVRTRHRNRKNGPIAALATVCACPASRFTSAILTNATPSRPRFAQRNSGISRELGASSSPERGSEVHRRAARR